MRIKKQDNNNANLKYIALLYLVLAVQSYYQASQQAKILMFNHLLKRDILNTLLDSNTYGVRCGTPYFKVRVEVLF